MQNLPVFLIVLLLTPSLCHAYVGPGVGLTVITSLLALGSAFFITLFGFIWLPIKRFFKGDDEESTENSETDDSGQEKEDEKKDSDTDKDNDNTGKSPH